MNQQATATVPGTGRSARVQPPSNPPMEMTAKAPTPAKRAGTDITEVVYGLALAALILIGLGTIAANFPAVHDRFETDNAVGATANAMEQIHRAVEIAAGLLMLILAALLAIWRRLKSR